MGASHSSWLSLDKKNSGELSPRSDSSSDGKDSFSDGKDSFSDEKDFDIGSEARCLTVIVLGASGDLAKKKTFPALFNLYRQVSFIYNCVIYMDQSLTVL